VRADQIAHVNEIASAAYVWGGVIRADTSKYGLSPSEVRRTWTPPQPLTRADCKKVIFIGREMREAGAEPIQGEW
jgi:hypothetical protein